MKKTFKRGFTLVELLVVVLIIGILSSVALPQYQKAVNKSRIAGYWPVLKNLAEAAKHCALEKGSACSLDELDIEAPTCKPLPGGSTCTYSVGASSEQISGCGTISGDSRCQGAAVELGTLRLGVDSSGRYCGGDCVKYGLTGASTDVYAGGIRQPLYYALDSTSR